MESSPNYSVGRALFKAIHEGKWLSIEYQNQNQQLTRYWIAVKSLSCSSGRMRVDGMHLGKMTVQELSMYIGGIRSAQVIDGSWCHVNQRLVQDILESPHKYEALFGDTANLRILEYLTMCSRLDNTPYRSDYSLIHELDEERFEDGRLPLSEQQFAQIVQQFQRSTSEQTPHRVQLQELGLNLMSIHTEKGLYLLAYRPLLVDIAGRQLRARNKAVICREFTIGGTKVSAHSFLDAEDYGLLDDFDENTERLKDCITRRMGRRGVDDMPYLVAVARDDLVDLEYQYQGILKMFQSPEKQELTPPIRAFFGEVTPRNRRRKSFPLALVGNEVNLDQLLAINKAMRYPLAYVQGPPGTGKTSTIVNTMTTAFFNERTVLFTSYNNHPIDGVVEKLQNMFYQGKKIPFPIVRLGSNLFVEKALDTMRQLYEECKEVSVFEKALDTNHAQRAEYARRLTKLLERYDEILDLEERRETIRRLLDARTHMNFQYELQAGQLPQVEAELRKKGTVTAEDALALLDRDQQGFLRYLYYTSVRCIHRLDEPKNKELRQILFSDEQADVRVAAFNAYLSNSENLKKFLKIFPFVATTCISAQKLGRPEPIFDMVIMDEASQCNTAVSLVPILRGFSLMLVGDPQQLQPVILLSEQDNETLRRRYHVSEEYDYIENSIYKCFLANDSVSDEVLLRYHYRCAPQIIEFNNKKYYNERLMIASKEHSAHPLVYVDISNNLSSEKNTAPAEVDFIDRFLEKHPEKSVGIITPFSNQREQIERMISAREHLNASCGTVHAFQGDEKDVVIFSLALTDRTRPETYGWLKNNKELINVATSRARQQLIVLSGNRELERLHAGAKEDDIYELVQYVRSNGVSEVSKKPASSRALGVQPFTSETETAFLQNLNHALDNVFVTGSRCAVRRGVAVESLFTDAPSDAALFYTGQFDFVVYQREGRRFLPVLAIELDAREHRADPAVQRRDEKKRRLCKEQGFELIRVDNTYARRYHYIKEILIRYFHAK